MDQIHPTPTELRLLEIGYDRFLNLYEEIMSDSFWRQRPKNRLLKIKDICAVYAELIKYSPIQDKLRNANRPNQTLVGRDFALFLRNLLLHFPFFERWSEICFDRNLITAFESSRSIDKFMLREHPEDIRYRFWDPHTKTMTYVHLQLNTDYRDGGVVWIKNIVPEKDGVRFMSVFMFEVLMTQLDSAH